ncbi:MAG: T9SS type A sorting domain-containing protein [Bacteroidota bacterium]
MQPYFSFTCLSLLSLLLPIFLRAQSTPSTCNFFEEQNGLLVVEMENLSLTESWEVAQEIPGFTGSGYIQWTGTQYFNQVGRGVIRLRIRINTPGTYVFNWRVAVANGNDQTLHNDTWLKIKGDVFYAKKGVLFLSPIKPRPNCNTDPNFDCPNGSSAAGFFKVFGGTVNRFSWKAKTSDHDAHDVVVRFDSIGTYELEINARSSFHAIDRMILWNTQTQRAVNAEKLSNRPSNCLINLITSNDPRLNGPTFVLYPNPVKDQFQLEFQTREKRKIILRNTLGKEIRAYTSDQQIISLPTKNLAAGWYWVEVVDEGGERRGKPMLKS